MSRTIRIGEYKIPLEDFLAAAEYVLTNTDLEPDDPRLQFVQLVQSMKQVDGYDPGRKRLVASESATLPLPF
jgi:hypothetical protein